MIYGALGLCFARKLNRGNDRSPSSHSLSLSHTHAHTHTHTHTYTHTHTHIHTYTHTHTHTLSLSVSLSFSFFLIYVFIFLTLNVSLLLCFSLSPYSSHFIFFIFLSNSVYLSLLHQPQQHKMVVFVVSYFTFRCEEEEEEDEVSHRAISYTFYFWDFVVELVQLVQHLRLRASETNSKIMFRFICLLLLFTRSSRSFN